MDERAKTFSEEGSAHAAFGGATRSRGAALWLALVLFGATWLYRTCLGVDYAADDFWQVSLGVWNACDV